MEFIKRIQALESDINKKLKSNNLLIRIIGQEDKNKGKIVILKNCKIDKYYEIEKISECQIDIFNNNRKVENGLFIDYIGQWIYNLYNNIEYCYSFYGGTLNGKILNRDTINKISNETTIDFSKERENGLLVHRKELDNQPIVKGYIGPMFEKIDYGKIYLRYETKEVYNQLSR